MKSKLSIFILSVFFITMMFNAGFAGAQTPEPEQELVNGEAQSNLSGAKSEWKHFKITTPQFAKNLEIIATGGTGDMDLYMRFNQRPGLGTSEYDCRPFKNGNEETCQVAEPQNGVYYISLYGSSEFAGVTLTAKYVEKQPVEEKVLVNKTPLENQSGQKQAWTYYKVTVPQGANDLVIEAKGGTGDADLYTQFGKRPDTNTYECRPYKSGNNEVCNTSKPKAGDYYVGLYGFSDFSGLTLTATYQEGTPDPKVIDITNNQWVKNINANKDEWLFYRLKVPANTDKLQFEMKGDATCGDGDLYIRLNASPDAKTYDCRPYRMGSNEVCDFPNPNEGDYYIGIHAYEKVTNLCLRARFASQKYGSRAIDFGDVVQEDPAKLEDPVR